MAISLKKALKTVLPILFGVFLIWYWFSATSSEDLQQIYRHIREADMFWVSLSIIIGLLSHVSRAMRWSLLLEPLGHKPQFFNNFLIILMAYLANLGIPRSGEFLRATALTTYEKVPFEKGFGTIVTERVIDLLMLFLVILVALVLQTDAILGFLENQGLGLNKLLILMGLGVAGLLVFFLFIRKASSGILLKVRNFVRGLMTGVMSIFKMRNKWLFVAHTLFIWVAYFAMFWIIKYTVPETMGLSVGQLLVAFIAGAFAMTATNGGIGLYPLAVGKALALYGISSASGDAFGWIMWISQTLMVLVFGAISFMVLPLWNRNR